MDTVLSSLNPAQKEAVIYHNAPLLILAGAGSGKTRVLTHRIAYFIKKGVSPSTIIAVTFTNKAAEEMRKRISSLVESFKRELWIGTFHSVCLRILKSEKIVPDFIIYDEADQTNLVKECIKRLNLSDKQFRPKAVLEKISRAKDALLDIDEYSEFCGNFYEKKVADIYKEYQIRLKEIKALDFGDLIMNTVKIFNDFPDILDKYRSKFRHIFVDEYQDTNHAQYELIRLLAVGCASISVVGDPDQSIYKWRGADISNIMNFERDFAGAKIIKLEENYRSTQAILSAANSVIKNNTNRKEKSLWTRNLEGANPIYYQAYDEIEEAKFISEQIKNLLINNNKTYKNIAIFYRVHALSRLLEDSFRREGIPYKIIGGVRFYDRKEVKDILGYLRMISNPNDLINIKRIINLPPRGIGDTTLKKLEKSAKEKKLPLFSILDKIANVSDLTSGTKNKIKNFVNIIKKYQTFKGSITKMAKDLIAEINYTGYLHSTDPSTANEREENVFGVVSAIAEYEEKTQNPLLRDFLDQVALLSNVDNWDSESNAITLMTVHGAKGLEFPVCFMAGMEEDIFPHINSSLETSDLEEERRLCYVGMTRAKEKLYLSSALRRRLHGTWRNTVTSRFIDEIPDNLLVKTYKRTSLDKSAFSSQNNFTDNSLRYESLEDDAYAYKVGQRIMHPKWGRGTVVSKTGRGDKTKLTVHFWKENIRKTLLVKYANLRNE
ncbi:MAG: UvrD-helicase domain-containing protein [bacterium]|nr:UvrD-helicase domain-containing protein [bacterium]